MFITNIQTENCRITTEQVYNGFDLMKREEVHRET